VYFTINTINRTQLNIILFQYLFSSEPDISLIGLKGTTYAVIEIKGGTDPAGALERYGAAKKSFDESYKQNKNVITILLAICIISEVKKRIESDETISRYFNLTSLLMNENERKSFLNSYLICPITPHDPLVNRL
jgi:hypothetical protein